MWIEENARGLIVKIAAAKLWRDTYQDARSDQLVDDQIGSIFTPEDVRLARALLETK